MPRPIFASISQSALRHNLATVRRHLDDVAAKADGTPPSIWAVIKANAYGHGIEQAVAGFSAAQGLAMLDLQEAVRCREAGWGGLSCCSKASSSRPTWKSSTAIISPPPCIRASSSTCWRMRGCRAASTSW